MLREDTLRTIQSTIARSDAAIPTRDEVSALEKQARQLRAQAMRDAFRNGFSWLFRHRVIELPAGRIDVVRGH